jgi:hypothetical protein
MESIPLLAIFIGIVLSAGVSKRIRDTIITLPMLYVLLGLGAGLLLRERIELSFDDPLVHIIAGLTLVLVLATDASRIKLRSVFDHDVFECDGPWHQRRPVGGLVR